MFKHNDIEIYWLKHSGFKIKTKEGVIYIDPYEVSGDHEKADVILITHSHYDHFDEPTLKALVKPETAIFCSEDCKEPLSKWAKVASIEGLLPHQEKIYGHLKILTTPAYNVDKPFHPKDKAWIGFILEIGKTKIYISGDTDYLPELDHIQCDIALLAVSGIYVMTPDEAANLANKIRPTLVSIPMHWGTLVDDHNMRVGTLEDAKRFCDLCETKALILEPIA